MIFPMQELTPTLPTPRQKTSSAYYTPIAASPESSQSPQKLVRAVRPALVDLRFRGDPGVLAQEEGQAGLYLGRYCLLNIAVSPFDVPVLNRALLQLRLGQARRQLNLQRRKLSEAAVAN